MVDLPSRYYVQLSRSASTYGPPRGWETKIVTFDRETAAAYAASFERATVFEDGQDITSMVSTVARVVTADELRAESEMALARAEAETRIQFWKELEEWAKTLIEPGHT